MALQKQPLFMTDYQLIEKEKVTGLTFPVNDVIADETERKLRSIKIHRATSLGNIESIKVYILFEDEAGLKRVFTTIWAQTHEKIVLKKGIFIPVNRILDIRFS